MMKLIVTGGAGFIGSAVVRQAIKSGHHVLVIDNLSYAACLDTLASVADNPLYEFEYCDIRDKNALDNILVRFMPDAIMHLAAESHVDRSIEDASNFISSNIIGTYNVLESARYYATHQAAQKPFMFHHVSTDEVFGSLSLDRKDEMFHEASAYAPSSPYAASKASADHLVRAWYKTYKLPIIITNCSNNYGPYQSPEKLIPLTILNALSGKPLPIYGTGANIRDWLFVEDHANALLNVLTKGQVGETYCIGGNCERTNLEVVRQICIILDNISPLANGRYADLITFVDDRLGHDERYAIDAQKLQDDLKWKPATSFDEGLEMTVTWYFENTDWLQVMHAQLLQGRK